MSEENESLSLENSKRLTNWNEARPTPLGDLLGENLRIASVATRDDAMTQMFDDMGDGAVVRTLRSGGTTPNC